MIDSIEYGQRALWHVYKNSGVSMDYANSRSFLGARIIGYLGGVLVGALAIASLIFTYVFPLSYIEFPILSERYALVSSVLTIVAFIVFVMSHRVLHWSVTELPLWLVFMVSLVVGIVWSFVADLPPQADQGIASHYAVKLIQNDINSFNDVYIQQYPFQSGYILYLALLYSIFGVENWFAVRIINSFFAAFCVMMIPAIAKVLFRDRPTVAYSGYLALFFLPLSLFSNFIYGNIPSAAFCLLCCWLQLVCMEMKELRTKIILGGCFVISIFLALWMKSNSLIFLMGFELLWLVMAIVRKSGFNAVLVIVTAVVYCAASFAPLAVISSKTGVTFDKAQPKTVWIAMGLQSSTRADGWFNEYPNETYAQAEGNPEKMNSMAVNTIRNRVTVFLKDPRYAASFFAQKELTQWTEPTFQSLWIVFSNIDTDAALKSGNLVRNSLQSGHLHTVYVVWCDVLQSVIYVAVCVCFVRMRKRWDYQKVLPLIIMMGGFAFHTIWEAKSDYILPYFVLLIPYAAYGLHSIVGQRKQS